MSRLIVKNIPKNISDKRLKEIFGKHGEVTQIKIQQKRRFAYIGYMDAKEANAALKYLHDTYIDTSKIEVSSALAYGDTQLPRAWSKYTSGSSANSQLKSGNAPAKPAEEAKEKLKKQENARIAREKKLLADIYALKKGDADDSEKQEYWNVMGSKSTKRSWANEGIEAPGKAKVAAKFEQVEGKKYGSKGETLLRSHVTFGDESDEDYQEINNDNDNDTAGQGPAQVEEPEVSRDDAAVDDSISDMQYFMSKMKNDGEDTEVMDETEDTVAPAKEEAPTKLSRKDKKKKKKQAKGGDDGTKDGKPQINTVRLRGLPFTATEVEVKEFFYPLEPTDIRMPTDRFDRPSGRAYCDFEPEDIPRALQHNQDHMGERYIEVSMDDEGKPEDKPILVKPPSKWANLEVDVGAFGESGRIFVRNLAYQCEEDHLKVLFEKFGPLSEVTIPIDKETKKSKAIGFITYMMPEHALVAYQALDGQPFQGRLLHLLPAKEKKDLSGVDPDQSDDNNYKKNQIAKRKSESTDAFNWNTLFMRQDTVAGAMATAYGVEKGDILDKDSTQSIAVRMALGETHIVAENKKFLDENGVKLEAFDSRVSKRSKTLILVKNTPYDTEEHELRAMFSKHGDVGRVIIPPSKTMAIVEMVHHQEARAAFKGLAYRKFKHVPLYLEWAPDECLEPVKEPTENTAIAGTTDEASASGAVNVTNNKDADEDDDDKEEEDSNRTNPTLFVKNLNFDTTDAGLLAFFERCTAVRSARVAKKKNMRGDGQLSMGFGFVEFSSDENAMKALKELQNSELDGHKVELKFSKKAEGVDSKVTKTRIAAKGQGTKLLLKNLGFETNKKELRDLCSAFGQIKSVRLPKKFDGNHRGFAFVDFLTKKEAMSAFEALSTSTHLYGRRIVVEFAKEDSSLEDLQDKTRATFGAKGNVRATKRAKFEEKSFADR
eukprot:m.11430 g.11430  ORF g.11430 m.11430 type:complete len:941 (-) comp8809_c0_seq1:378-3200(-)